MSYLVNPYMVTSASAQTCQGESYSGETTGLGQEYGSGFLTLVGMIPRADNTLLGIIANKFSIKCRHLAVGAGSDLTINAKIFNDSAVEQAVSTNQIVVETTDTTMEFRQFEFASDFEVTVGYYYVINQYAGTFVNANRVEIQMNPTPADNNTLCYYTNAWYLSWFGTYKPVSICFTG